MPASSSACWRSRTWSHIEGLSPAIAIQQRTSARNPRSTVGTVTEIYDYLRLLFARIGKPHCPNCGRPISSQTTDQIVDAILAGDVPDPNPNPKPETHRPGGDPRPAHPRPQRRVQRPAPAHQEARLRPGARGRQASCEIDEVPELERYKKHTIEVVVDRLILEAGHPQAPRRLGRTRLARRRRSGHGAREVRGHDRQSEIRNPKSEIHRSGIHLLRGAGLPGLRVQPRRGHAPALLVQCPVRRVPGVLRPRHADGD